MKTFNISLDENELNVLGRALKTYIQPYEQAVSVIQLINAQVAKQVETIESVEGSE